MHTAQYWPGPNDPARDGALVEILRWGLDTAVVKAYDGTTWTAQHSELSPVHDREASDDH